MEPYLLELSTVRLDFPTINSVKNYDSFTNIRRINSTL